MTKPVYQLDRFHCLLSLVPADQIDNDPEEEGRRLIPGGCIETDEAPPPVGEHQVAKWDGTSWVIVPDFRGTSWWEKTTHAKHVVTVPEEVPPADAHLSDPGPSAAQKLVLIKTAAFQALAKSDLTVLRCFENGVTLPAAWRAYRNTLRALVNEIEWSDTLVIPPEPTYPEGS